MRTYEVRFTVIARYIGTRRMTVMFLFQYDEFSIHKLMVINAE